MDVQVVATGFGSFNGVAANPTQRIVGWLQQRYCVGSGDSAAHPAARSLRHGRIHSCTILKVSARAVNAYLIQQLEELKQRGLAACASSRGPEAACSQPTVVLLLHFGVDVQRPWFNLETRAINNATFRSPDEDGWRPNACPITPVPGMPLESSVGTDLDLQRLHRHLRGRGHDVQLSGDPGKFVCNWTYYNSLALCREAMAVAALAAAAAAAPAAAADVVMSPASDSGRASSCSTTLCGRSSSTCSSASSIGGGDGSCSDAANDAHGGAGAAASPQRQALLTQRHRYSSSKRRAGGGSGLAVHSLFVHVPAFDSISEAKQQRFAVDLIESLCDQLHHMYWGGGGGSGGNSDSGLPRHARYHRQQQSGRGHGLSRGNSWQSPQQQQPQRHQPLPPLSPQQQYQQQAGLEPTLAGPMLS